jgi:protein-disulfide isomerase
MPNLGATFLVSLLTAVAVVAAAAGINHAWPIFGTNGDGGNGSGTPSGQAAQNTPAANATPQPVSIDAGDNPAKGPVDASVTVVEFSDFQCPYCARFTQETLPAILSNYSDKVRFVFMNFPLTSIHANAEKAAEAAECAYDQGAFWEYHDLLFQNQAALDADSLKGYAASLGLNASQFNECLDSGEKADEVEKDMTAAQKAVQEAGLDRFGTPAFFINGNHLGGAQPFDVFKQAIDAALAAAE